MKSFNESMQEYRKQLEKGEIIEAYRGLMKYFNKLRLHFQKKYPHHNVSSNVYYGYMDMTYFSLFPDSLKRQKLKIAIVFLHETFRFEVWLAAINKKVQTKYWKLIKENKWNKYNIPPTTKGFDSIVEYVLIENPDFNNLNSLTEQIEKGTLKFTKDIEDFLSRQQNLFF